MDPINDKPVDHSHIDDRPVNDSHINNKPVNDSHTNDHPNGHQINAEEAPAATTTHPPKSGDPNPEFELELQPEPGNVEPVRRNTGIALAMKDLLKHVESL
eukprot:CAMPEP_0174339796 /NCGR_PEP_ID=MMETSP0810-20121108/24187_1 /TAXON_ID=73025 ORGANISM="Eutreptiella gymnastica-like, Strain CCMP1594" /NCGR_SAMPLE_ID=MMETSP0810 /ASSEMBLY_ACC=CAM_ASM_000659 /LENGTH=100 /DNA_ID=CAMNT_0015460625 /DNA_START=80 /DNA_END=379 /DNA_ORIENTATION=-